MKRLVLVLPLAGALAACSGARENGPADAAALERQAMVARIRAAADQAPDWYLNPPRDEHFFYAAGTGISGDLQFSIDKAILNAKFALADQMKSSLSGRQKDFVRESSADARPGMLSEKTTSNVIVDVALPGYRVAEKKVVPIDTEYRSYVLLQFAVIGALPPQPALSAAKAGPPPMTELEEKAGIAHQELENEIAAARAKTADGPPQVSSGNAAPPPAAAADEPPPPAAAPRDKVEVGEP